MNERDEKDWEKWFEKTYDPPFDIEGIYAFQLNIDFSKRGFLAGRRTLRENEGSKSDKTKM